HLSRRLRRVELLPLPFQLAGADLTCGFRDLYDHTGQLPVFVGDLGAAVVEQRQQRRDLQPGQQQVPRQVPVGGGQRRPQSLFPVVDDRVACGVADLYLDAPLQRHPSTFATAKLGVAVRRDVLVLLPDHPVLYGDVIVGLCVAVGVVGGHPQPPLWGSSVGVIEQHAAATGLDSGDDGGPVAVGFDGTATVPVGVSGT